MLPDDWYPSNPELAAKLAAYDAGVRDGVIIFNDHGITDWPCQAKANRSLWEWFLSHWRHPF